MLFLSFKSFLFLLALCCSGHWKGFAKQRPTGLAQSALFTISNYQSQSCFQQLITQTNLVEQLTHKMEDSELQQLDISSNGFEQGGIHGLQRIRIQDYQLIGVRTYRVSTDASREWPAVYGLTTIDRQAFRDVMDWFSHSQRLDKIKSRVDAKKDKIKKRIQNVTSKRHDSMNIDSVPQGLMRHDSHISHHSRDNENTISAHHPSKYSPASSTHGGETHHKAANSGGMRSWLGKIGGNLWQSSKSKSSHKHSASVMSVDIKDNNYDDDDIVSQKTDDAIDEIALQATLNEYNSIPSYYHDSKHHSQAPQQQQYDSHLHTASSNVPIQASTTHHHSRSRHHSTKSDDAAEEAVLFTRPVHHREEHNTEATSHALTPDRRSNAMQRGIHSKQDKFSSSSNDGSENNSSSKSKSSSIGNFWSKRLNRHNSASNESDDRSSSSSKSNSSLGSRLRDNFVSVKRRTFKQMSDKHISPYWTSFKIVLKTKRHIPIQYNLMLTSGAAGAKNTKTITSDIRPMPLTNAKAPSITSSAIPDFYAMENQARSDLGLTMIFDTHSQLIKSMRLPKDVQQQRHTSHANRLKITAYQKSQITSSVELSVKKFNLCEATSFKRGGDGEEGLADLKAF